MPIYKIDQLTPVIMYGAYVHPMATLIGDVIIHPNTYIGPNASLRGDFGRVEIRAGANVQDCCICHSFPEIDVIVEEDGHIGHGAILHGCTIEKNALIGMNSVIMDGATISENSIVGAMSFVKARATFPPNSLIFGNPASAQRELDEKEIAWKSLGTAEYQHLNKRSLATMKEVEPLTEVDTDRERYKNPNIKLKDEY